MNLIIIKAWGPPICVMGWPPFYVLKSTAAEMKQKLYLTKHIAGYNDSDLPARPNMRRVVTGCSLAWMDGWTGGGRGLGEGWNML